MPASYYLIAMFENCVPRQQVDSWGMRHWIASLATYYISIKLVYVLQSLLVTPYPSLLHEFILQLNYNFILEGQHPSRERTCIWFILGGWNAKGDCAGLICLKGQVNYLLCWNLFLSEDWRKLIGGGTLKRTLHKLKLRYWRGQN